MPRETHLETLFEQGLVWRGNVKAPQQASLLASGFAGLDAVVGGWPQGALSELFSVEGVGFSLLLPLLAQLSREAKWLALIGPPWLPYAPALQARGVDPAKVLLVKAADEGQALWATEQALRSANCSLVMAWPQRMTPGRIRRLQLAAEEGRCMAVLFRPWRERRQASVAALRLALRPAGAGLQVEVLKRRGGWGGEVLEIPCAG